MDGLCLTSLPNEADKLLLVFCLVWATVKLKYLGSED